MWPFTSDKDKSNNNQQDNTATVTTTVEKPQPPSLAHLHPPTTTATTKKQQGLGIGRDSKTPVVAIISDEDAKSQQGKFFTDCQKEYLASINCRLEHIDHKATNACQSFFDTYKACRVEENKRRLEENAKRGGMF